jgi:hypothetical protein
MEPAMVSRIAAAPRHGVAAMHLLQAHDTRVEVGHRCRGRDVVRVEGSREPEVNEFW